MINYGILQSFGGYANMIYNSLDVDFIGADI